MGWRETLLLIRLQNQCNDSENGDFLSNVSVTRLVLRQLSKISLLAMVKCNFSTYVQLNI